MTIGGGEIAAERAIQVVAHRGSLLVKQFGLGEHADVRQRREGDIGQREPDERALTGAAAMALGSEQAVPTFTKISPAGGSADPCGPTWRERP